MNRATSPLLVILDVSASNSRALKNAFTQLGYHADISNEQHIIDSASHLVVPGVGAFGTAVKILEQDNVWSRLKSLVSSDKVILGVCLGMHLLGDASEEAPGVSGLGVFNVPVKRLNATTVSVPHVGWNEVRIESPHWIFNGLESNFSAYFSHSFYYPKNPYSLGVTDHGEEFSSVMARDSVVAMQFHPERSQGSGLKILHNFVTR